MAKFLASNLAILVTIKESEKMYTLNSNLVSHIIILLLMNSVLAGPYPRDDLTYTDHAYLLKRNCASYCGAQDQYCCAVGEACYTNHANVAFCSAGAPDEGIGYAVFTTTYTETNLILRTSTYTSSWVQATSTWVPGPIATPPPTCTSSLGESSCGDICCANDQRCAFINSCTAYKSSDETTYTSTYLAPFRPTSGDVSTISATTTVPFQPPATATGSDFPVAPLDQNQKLSAGATAGIVIGVIAGVAFLLFFCLTCVLKLPCAGLCGCLGLGRKKKHQEKLDNSGSESKNKVKKVAIIVGGLAALLQLMRVYLKKEKQPPSNHPPSSISSSTNGTRTTSDDSDEYSDESSRFSRDTRRYR